MVEQRKEELRNSATMWVYMDWRMSARTRVCVVPRGDCDGVFPSEIFFWIFLRPLLSEARRR